MKKSAQLPHWFNVANYSGLDSISDSGLLQELRYRHSMATHSIGYGPGANQIQRTIMYSPLRQSRDSAKKGAKGPKTVVPMTTYDILGFTRFDGNFFDYFSEQMKAVEVAGSDHEESERDRRHAKAALASASGMVVADWAMVAPARLDSLDSMFPDSIHLHVNTNADDEEIIEDFRAALKAYRDNQASPPPKKTETIPVVLRKVRELKVIPFLDLITWAHARDVVDEESHRSFRRKYGGHMASLLFDEIGPDTPINFDYKKWIMDGCTKLNLNVVARTLFPDDYEIGDKQIREQTRKYAIKAMEEAFLNSLESRFSR